MNTRLLIKLLRVSRGEQLFNRGPDEYDLEHHNLIYWDDNTKKHIVTDAGFKLVSSLMELANGTIQK